MKQMYIDFMRKLGDAMPGSRAMLESAVAYLESLESHADLGSSIDMLKHAILDLQSKAASLSERIETGVKPAVDAALSLVSTVTPNTDTKRFSYVLAEIEAIFNGMLNNDEAKPEYVQKYAVREGVVERIKPMMSYINTGIKNCRQALLSRGADEFMQQHADELNAVTPSYARRRIEKPQSAKKQAFVPF